MQKSLGVGVIGCMIMGCAATADDGGEASTDMVRANAAALEEHTLLDITSDLEAPAQPSEVLYGQLVLSGEPVTNLAPQAPERFVDVALEHKTPIPAFAPGPKIAAELAATVEQLNARGEGTSLVDVMVLFRETLKIPRFPSLRPDEPRSSPENMRVLATSNTIAERLLAARTPQHARIAAELAPLGGKVGQSHWLVNALAVTLPANAVGALADRPDVPRCAKTACGTRW